MYPTLGTKRFEVLGEDKTAFHVICQFGSATLFRLIRGSKRTTRYINIASNEFASFLPLLRQWTSPATRETTRSSSLWWKLPTRHPNISDRTWRPLCSSAWKWVGSGRCEFGAVLHAMPLTATPAVFLQLCADGNLPNMQRQLALEVIVTLSETAAAMLRKHTDVVAQSGE